MSTVTATTMLPDGSCIIPPTEMDAMTKLGYALAILGAALSSGLVLKADDEGEWRLVDEHGKPEQDAEIAEYILRIRANADAVYRAMKAKNGDMGAALQ